MIKTTWFALPPYYHDMSTVVISIHRQDTHIYRAIEEVTTQILGRKK